MTLTIVFPIGYLLPGICYNINEGSDSYVCYLFCPRIISVSSLPLLHYDGINLHYRHNFGCLYCDSKSVKTILSENQVLLFPTRVKAMSCSSRPFGRLLFCGIEPFKTFNPRNQSFERNGHPVSHRAKPV